MASLGPPVFLVDLLLFHFSFISFFVVFGKPGTHELVVPCSFPFSMFRQKRGRNFVLRCACFSRECRCQLQQTEHFLGNVLLTIFPLTNLCYRNQKLSNFSMRRRNVFLSCQYCSGAVKKAMLKCVKWWGLQILGVRFEGKSRYNCILCYKALVVTLHQDSVTLETQPSVWPVTCLMDCPCPGSWQVCFFVAIAHITLIVLLSSSITSSVSSYHSLTTAAACKVAGVDAQVIN